MGVARRPLVEAAAGELLDRAFAELVRESPAGDVAGDAGPRPDLEDVADGGADEIGEQWSGRKPGGEHHIGAVLGDRLSRTDALHAGTGPQPGDRQVAERAFLLGVHARGRLRPGAAVGLHDLEIRRDRKKRRAEMSISGSYLEHASRAAGTEGPRERPQERSRREEIEGTPRIEFAKEGKLATGEGGERAVERGSRRQEAPALAVPEKLHQRGAGPDRAPAAAAR